MRIDFVNMAVSEGATILAAIFNNLLGIISRPVAFFSTIFLNRLKMVLRRRGNGAQKFAIRQVEKGQISTTKR